MSTYQPSIIETPVLPVDPVVPATHPYIERIPARYFDVAGYRGLEEKARLLGMPLACIAKTYVMESRGSRLYLGVFSADKRLDERLYAEEATRFIVGRDGQEGRLKHRLVLRKAERLPTAMTRGTCGPFVSDHDLPYADRGKVSAVIFDDDLLSRGIVDFAVPSQRGISMHADIADVYAVLAQLYPKIVTHGKITR